MAIELGRETVEVTQTEVTWRLQGDFVDSQGNVILDPTIEVFRGVIKRIGDQVIFTPNPTPLRIKASELALLAPFAEVPSALSSIITDRASLTAHLSALPLLVMMSGDAMARKAIADAEAEAARIAQEQAASLAEQDLPQE
jgi:hypothetical protein